MLALKEHFTIICLNDDKDIVEPEKMDSFQLAELIANASAHLILIPRLANAVMLSASSQYQNMCLLEDLSLLHSSRLEQVCTRLSWLDPAASTFQEHSSFTRVLNSLGIERAYSLPKQFESCTIDRILMDETKQINLRDLPSFFYCSARVAALMKRHLGAEDVQQSYLRAGLEFARTALRSFGLGAGEERSSELQRLLEQQQLSEEERMEATDCVMSGCQAVLAQLQTVEVVQALLVLPYEYQRQDTL